MTPPKDCPSCGGKKRGIPPCVCPAQPQRDPSSFDVPCSEGGIKHHTGCEHDTGVPVRDGNRCEKCQKEKCDEDIEPCSAVGCGAGVGGTYCPKCHGHVPEKVKKPKRVHQPTMTAEAGDWEKEFDERFDGYNLRDNLSEQKVSIHLKAFIRSLLAQHAAAHDAKLKQAVVEMKDALANHYWDSFEKDKELIVKHALEAVEAVARRYGV